MEILIYIGIGLLGGLASGFFGIGGAVVIVPLLTQILNYPQKVAQGTTLIMFMIAPSFLAGIQYYRSGNTNMKAVLLLWIGVFIGATIGAWFVNTIFKDSQVFVSFLRKSFSIIMVLLAIKMWFS